MKQLIIVIVTLFFSCKSKNEENDINYVLKHNPRINDSILKLKEYNHKLGSIYLDEVDNIKIIQITIIPNIPHTLNINYNNKFIKINDFPFVVYSDKIKILKNESNSIKSELVKKEIIRFNDKGLFTNYPYWKFMYCSNNSTKMKCYDNSQIDKFYIQSMKKVSSENLISVGRSPLYPICN